MYRLMRYCMPLVFVLSLAHPASSLSGMDLKRLVDDAGVDGVIVLHGSSGEEIVSDAQRAQDEFLPASTYKILHALIALETGVVSEDTVIPWDGVDRGYSPWNEDQTLKSAIQNSTVWAFQHFARSIGRDRMQKYIDLAGYGNRDISGDLDSFWLDGGLRISPQQQIAFLQKLFAGDLPFSKAHMDYVKACLEIESGEHWVMRAKTGWAQRVTPQIGWLVGWVENRDRVIFFATNLVIASPPDAKARFTISKKALEEFGAFQ